MNIQFGSAFTATQFNGPSAGEDRQGVAVPSQAEENKDTTSFTSLGEPSASDKGKQEGSEQGSEQRQTSNQEQVNTRAQERENRRAQQKNDQEVNRSESRAEKEQQTESRKTEKANDQSQVEQRAQERRQQEAAEQRQLEAELQQIQKLADRDREVRAHEQAHQSVGGQYAGSATYTYERGPDGQNYAIGGEVSIDVGKAATPEATLDKAETVRRAALAPAEPSSQDRRVAAQATDMALDARAEIQMLQTEERLVETSEVEEDDDNRDVDEEERLDAEQKAQQEQQQAQIEANTSEVIAGFQELNERMSRIQSQLAEISQFDDKVNSKVNLLDVAT